MNVQELYDHITKHMSAEEALKKLLEGTIRTYNHLKFKEGEEIHPTMLVAMAALDMGWSIAIPNGDDDAELEGMIIGSDEYIDSILNDTPSCDGDCECDGNCGCHD